MRGNSSFVLLALLLLCSLAAAQGKPPKAIVFKGYVVAYRPYDRANQVASFVENKAVFLFSISDDNQKVVLRKIVCRHLGYSDIPDDALAGKQLLALKVKRKPNCDESFAHFVSNAPVIRISGSDGKRNTPSVIFAPDFNARALAPELKLKCYVVHTGDVTVATR
jgi:hypothetical protein